VEEYPLPRVIIVEGSDGSGKTTLAGSLSVRLGYGYVHMSTPDDPKRPFDYWWRRIYPELRKYPGLVLDRLHWSEKLYGELFRGGSGLSEHDRWVLEGWLLGRGACVIRCQPPLENVLASVSKDPNQLHHSQEMTRAVYAEYTKSWDTVLPVVTFDYTVDGPSTRLNPHLFLPRIPSLSLVYPGIGYAQPRAVLVGDRHNLCNLKKMICHDPLVFRSTSGDFLRRALQSVGLTLYDYYIINGWTDSEVYLTPEPTDVKPLLGSTFIALGKQGEAALTAGHLPSAGNVGHPQWWRRFHHAELEEYGRQICSLIPTT